MYSVSRPFDLLITVESTKEVVRYGPALLVARIVIEFSLNLVHC
jgi:hypothetical protein